MKETRSTDLSDLSGLLLSANADAAELPVPAFAAPAVVAACALAGAGGDEPEAGGAAAEATDVSPEAGQVGNQCFHFSIIQRQRDHAASFHLRSGRFQKCRQLSWLILSGNMSQRWPNAATSALSVASTAAVRIENTLPLGGGCIARRTSSSLFRRSGCRSRSRFSWRRGG